MSGFFDLSQLSDEDFRATVARAYCLNPRAWRMLLSELQNWIPTTHIEFLILEKLWYRPHLLEALQRDFPRYQVDKILDHLLKIGLATHYSALDQMPFQPPRQAWYSRTPEGSKVYGALKLLTYSGINLPDV
jgi:hypothetical protein